MAIEIRKPSETEAGEIIRMMRDFAGFESLSPYFENTAEKLTETIFGESAFVEALIAVDGDQFAGYALFFPFYASFRGQNGYYLDDLYVDSAFRGKGVGEAFLKEIARLGKARRFERIDFQVLEWNSPAIKFYEKLGAVRDADERHFKFVNGAFNGLAESL